MPGCGKPMELQIWEWIICCGMVLLEDKTLILTTFSSTKRQGCFSEVKTGSDFFWTHPEKDETFGWHDGQVDAWGNSW